MPQIVVARGKMAEIILFNEKRNGSAGSSSSAAAYAIQNQVNQDWDNQELADLYRVNRLLAQAGVAIETDRGQTDEGDPWFVFCHPNGDVFVHLSRFDGEYLLDSTSIDSPLRGSSFTDLINAFVDRAIEKRAANIVSLRPGEGVFLHPAIMLTALIWTLFVASDELVGIAHGAEIDQAAGDFDVLLNAPLSETDGAFGILQAALTEQDAQDTAADATPTTKNAIEPAEREVQSAATSAILPNPISLSLSAIAVTFGMSSKSSFEFLQNSQPTTEQDEQTTANSLELSAAQATEDAQTDRDVSAVSDDMAETSEANIEQAKSAGAQAQSQHDLDVFNVPNSIVLTKGLSGNLDGGGFDTGLAGVFDVFVSQTTVSTVEQGFTEAKTSVQTNQSEPKASSPQGDDNGSAPNLSTSLQLQFDFGQNVSLSAYSIANQELFASFDISSIQGVDWNSMFGTDLPISILPIDHGDLDHKPETPTPTGHTIRASQITEYSQEAMTFVKYLLAERDTVEMVVLEGKIILVDLSAFDDVTDISYLRSWSYDDVGIVSTIGHLSDFEAFDLVLA